MDERIGGNINGPSLLRVPDWVERPLGKYYLYFAHHQGQFIRLAYSNDIAGPYTVHSPGVLDIEDTAFSGHIASPDVHVDVEARRIWMHYHGCRPTRDPSPLSGQLTCYAESRDGLRFQTDDRYLSGSYLRTVCLGGMWYGFTGGGGRRLLRSDHPREVFEAGPVLEIGGETFSNAARLAEMGGGAPGVNRARHVGLHLRGNDLDIYYSSIGDEPERIKRTMVDVSRDWATWEGSHYEEVLRSEADYEGVGEPLVASGGGASHVPVHQVRDPYIFVEDGEKYLLYSVAGECGIAAARIREPLSS